MREGGAGEPARCSVLVPEGDASLGQVVGRDIARHTIPHLARARDGVRLARHPTPIRSPPGEGRGEGLGVGAAKRVSLWGAAESGAGTGWPGRLPPRPAGPMETLAAKERAPEAMRSAGG